MFNWLTFIAYKKISVAQFETIFQSYAIVATFLGWILLHESLNRTQLLGSGLLICGALIAANASQEDKKQQKRVSRGIYLAGLAALCIGIALVAEKAALARMTVSAYFIFGYGTQAIAAVVIGARAGLRLPRGRYTAKELTTCAALGILSALGGFFYILTLTKTNNVSLTTVVSTFVLPLSVLGSYFILREREHKVRMFIACVVAFAGLALCAR